MPLQRQILVQGLRSIMDKEFEGFSGFPKAPDHPKTEQRRQNKWATIVNRYGSMVTPPSSTSTQAKQAFKPPIAGVNNTVLGGGVSGLKNALVAYVNVLGQGMQPTFSAKPPTKQELNLKTTLGTPGSDGTAKATALATDIDIWFRKGTATNNTSGATINWS